ncbi:MAG: hypothetical protein M1125_01340 [Candidatus Marsarchaeota archaeon]|nr:hypothetical protein [Candidatus Marsarchaeota archaeon]
MHKNAKNAGSADATLGKMIALGAYAEDEWPNAIKFDTKRDASEFLIGMLLIGDEKSSSKALSAIRSTLSGNCPGEEREYFIHVGTALAEGNGRHAQAAGKGLMVLDCALEEGKKSACVPYAMEAIRVRDSEAMGIALRIVYEYGTEGQRLLANNALEADPSDGNLLAVHYLNYSAADSSKALAGLLGSSNPKIIEAAADTIYFSIASMTPQRANALFMPSLKALKACSAEGYSKTAEKLAGIASTLYFFIDKKTESRSMEIALELAESDSPAPFAAGYVLVDRMRLKRLGQKLNMPEGTGSKMLKFEYYEQVYRLTNSHSKNPDSLSVYESYMDSLYEMVRMHDIPESLYIRNMARLRELRRGSGKELDKAEG